MKIIFDMETGDPDDAWTLAWLLDHPDVDLLAVTITPGSPWQIAFVRKMFAKFNREARIGAYAEGVPGHLSGGCRAFLPDVEIEPDRKAENPIRLITELAADDVTFLSGAPPKNLAAALSDESLRIGRLVQQGGFVGSPIVPAEDQLDKFKGMQYCPTWNLGGAPKAAEKILSSPQIGQRLFVGKNICHGCTATTEIVSNLQASKHKSLFSIGQHVSIGKAMHDLLAACTALDPSCVDFADVNLHRQPNGYWGSKLENPNCAAAVRLHFAKFTKTLLRDTGL